MFEKLTLEVTLGFLRKAWPLLVLGVLFALLLIRSSQLDAARQQLENEAQFRGLLKVALDAPSIKAPDLLLTTQKVVEERDGFRNVINENNRQVLQAKDRADKADAALAQAQTEHQKKFTAAKRRINDLENRRSTGDTARDAAQIEEDTKAAWEGWR